MRKTLLLLSCLVCVGCATTGRLATPSGRPEVFIMGVTKKDVMDASVSLLVKNGWQIESTTEYMVQAVHTSDSMAADFFFGSSYSSYQTWYRIVFTFVQEPKGIRVFGAQKLIGNKGTGFENAMELTNQKAYNGTQSYLVLLRDNLMPSFESQNWKIVDGAFIK